MKLFQAEELILLGIRIFQEYGVSQQEAQRVTESLVESNLMGYDSHGVIRIPQYCRMIQQGLIVPGAPVEIVKETPTIAMLDAHWGFGQCAGPAAVEVALRKAQEWGISVVTLRRSNHIGRLGEYVQKAAEQGFVAFAAINNHGGSHRVAPWGGREPRLSTNPLAFAFPLGDPPFLLDMTTSALAEGKVRLARNQGKSLPEGCLLNAQGLPSTNPNDLYTDPPGAILPLGGPIGGHKGFGLALVVDLLAGGLSGGQCTQREVERIGQAMFLALFDPEALGGRESLEQQSQRLFEWVKSSQPMPGTPGVMLPGEPENRIKAQRLKEGIPIDEETLRQIRETAQQVGVEF